MQLYQGVVENRQDPLKLGRCQVRIIGLHTHDKVQLKTDDLPWAYPMSPVTSAAVSGIGHSPVGPVEGTWVIVMFRDDDQQYPVMLGTLGGIPQPPVAPDQDPDGVLLKDSEGNTPSNPSDVVATGSVNPTTTSSLTPQQQAQNLLQPGLNPIPTDIQTTPPAGTPNQQRAEAGIKAILAACQKFGLTTREQQCSLLAIAGGESLWVPKEEGYSYSAESLQTTFRSTFGGNQELAEQWERAPKKGITREQFFNFVYAPENNGKQLGNTQPDDGGKYYGRGFNGVTGRANYTKYGNQAGYDLINNPTLLTTNLQCAAEVFCKMVIDNPIVKKTSSTSSPGYFEAVKRANGNDTGNGAEVRKKYYEYFYGTKVPSSFTEEKTADPAPLPSTLNSTTSESYSEPGPSKSASGPIGFRDPHNKYPLKDTINEPDTNRLARGIKKGTIHPVKDFNRAADVPTALSSATFSEPLTSYSAKYPYNHVFETESGHVQEFDDTPGYERIMTAHRKGTFTEIDANGTQVNHIVGDSYQIIDRNGCIFIKGEANLTVAGTINILCQSEANIEVTGNANVEVGNDANIGISKNANMVVGQNMKLQVNETLDIKAKLINIESSTNLNVRATESLNETAPTINVSASSTYRETVGTSHYRWNGDKYSYIGANTHNRHNSGTDFSNSSDPTRTGSDGATMATAAQAAANATTNLTAPDNGILNPRLYPYLIVSPTPGEEEFLLETEDEWNTTAGKAAVAALAKEYGSQTPENTAAQDSTATRGGINKNIVSSCTIVNGTEIFTNDFRISPNFTLGMLIIGGVNGQNKLQDQLGLTVQEIVCNLSQLCVNILEPMLAILPNGIAGYKKTWQINSGFRASTNIPVGGVSKSDHMLGRAIDFTVLPYDSTKAERNYELAGSIEKILPYDQIIMEYKSGGSNWIHIGYRGINEGDTAGGGTNRKMAFTMLNGSTYRRDANGNPTGFYLL